MTDRDCLYGDRAAIRLVFILCAFVLGACLGCAVYGFIAWVAVCP
jgi:phage shock protein PspC (stress-responsive transcriptional regulator)